MRFPVVPFVLLLAGLGACRASLIQTFDPLSQSLASPTTPAVKLSPPVANVPSSVLQGCITEANHVADDPIEIQKAQLLRDGTFLIQWHEGSHLEGSCQVDGQGNVVAIASAKLPRL
ncbi:MAG: hypothetical protein HC886_05815 [Leptolyngbyaceae cyanobacterium SM1_1_3]|nr:hypothetical protein [Leptolyngbyaceae cyanobacterium SM1_1_3]